MIRSPIPLVFLLFLNACSLVHDESPNDPPTLQVSRMICQAPEKAFADTIVNGVGAICQVRRGGEVRIEVRGADEDDDPLVYRWNAFGAGSFRDSVAKVENSWFAPETILSDSEQFIIQVTIADRDCGLVPDPDDHQRCIEDSEEFVENFFVEVVQRRPVLSVIADTTVLFSEPQILIDAFGTDPDDDPLEYNWTQLEGRENGLNIGQGAIRDEETARQIGSRASILALFPDNYLLRASISDGEALIEREITVQVPIEPALPEGGMVRLTLPTTGREYEIDAYEYPNAKGETPLQATFFEAVSFCGAQGKRLCSPTEWRTACQGEEGLSFSSLDDPTAYLGLDHFGIRFCNVPGSIFTLDTSLDLADQVAPSGSFPNCGSTTGVFDLTGNLDEWTTALNAVNDLDVTVMRSNVAFEGMCDFERPAGTLPVAGENIYDPTVLQQQLEALDAFDRQAYEQELIGFRCCR